LLIIDAEKDDLVATGSSMALRKYVSSTEVESFTNPGGHVALCISDIAHKRLWPKAAEWIFSK
jgi:poly(3-hydroxyalkanoate) synthetase